MSNNKIYVGNLGYNVSNDALSTAFSQYGKVQSAKVIIDRDTNRSKGFAFVEMSTGDEAALAISRLNGTDMDGRTLTVTEAKPPVARDRPRY